jgi:uncharacterized protein (TIGR02996 family)
MQFKSAEEIMRRREEEFLRQIRLHPEEDGIRLVFADWLDEVGDERAELIRVQCECARLEKVSNGNPGENQQRLKMHEAELAALWRQSCLEELSPLGVKDVRFARGFVERVHLEGVDFLKRTKTLGEWAPAIRGVLWQKIPRLSAPPIQRFFDSDVFSSVTTLNLMRNNLGGAGVEALAHSPGLAGVRSLSLRGNPIGGQGMQELMRSAHLAGLSRWDLTETQLSLVDARNLARAASLIHLEELLLNHNQIGDAGLRAIANTDRLRTIRRLSVADNHIAQEGLRALADSPHLTDLNTLDLSGNEVGDAGLSLMASASNYARLTELNLAGCGIKPTGLANLAESPYFNRLSAFDLSHNPIGKGLPHLLESRLMENLQSLSLRHCDLDSQSVRPLLTAPLSLNQLDLRDNPLINQYTRESLAEKFGPRVQL